MSDTTNHEIQGTKMAVQQVDNSHSDKSGVHVVQRVHADGTVVLIDAHAIGGDLDEVTVGYFLSPNFICTFLSVCLASICAYLGWVLPANTLLLINADIGPSLDINWVGTSWTLGSRSVGFLIFGRLSDVFGRKYLVIAFQVLGLVGCIVGATAQSINVLIGSNLLNGIAAAGQLSFGIVIGELVPNKLRGPAITIIFLSSLPFAVFGPSIARAFFINTAQKWRWSYYIGIICNALALIGYVVFYHPPTYDQLHVHGKSKWLQFKELDFVGLFLFLAGCVLFLIGLSWGGSRYTWTSAYVLSFIIIGIVTLIVFVMYEAFVFKGQALMPPRIFKNVGYSAIVICATVGAMVYYSMTILWPSIIGNYTTDSEKIGIQSAVVGGGILLGQTFGGFGLSYVPKVKWQAMITSILGAAFVASLASIGPDTHSAAIALGILATFFIGYVDNITFPGVTLVLEAQDIGLASGVLGSIRGMGGAVAQSMYVSILTTNVAKYLPQYVTPAALAAGLPPSSLSSLYASMAAGDFSAVPGMTPEIMKAVETQTQRAYFSAFQVVFYATIPFGVLLVAAACFVPDMEQFLHNNIAKRLQHMGTKGGEAREGRELGTVKNEKRSGDDVV
ncbi:hypothetical protein EG328_010182 [Venturia inaequalis]|uniref:Major facilitator superfamily (MFS) profile domain-containing protein n=1 Tax=Venturia inaequalis TaxID=5025 RepID=A0A8H3V8S1_VENIN|nr:hypothetical protein EG328_010182 [Venturia inaequalis]